jgi:hypothetical protein
MSNTIGDFVKKENVAIFCYSTNQEIHKENKYDEDKDLQVLKKRLKKANKNYKRLVKKIGIVTNPKYKQDLMNNLGKTEESIRRLEDKIKSLVNKTKTELV